MTDDAADLLDRKARSKLGRKRLASRLFLTVERLVPALWPPLGVVFLFVAFSAAGGFSGLPIWAHLALLVAVAGGFLWLVVRSIRRYQPASGAESDRRLERANGLHRPLTALRDDLALGRADPATRGLWLAHRRQMADRIAALKAPAPNPEMPRRDPMALRFAAVFLLLLGLAIGWVNIPGNLAQAFLPRVDAVAGETAVLEAWLTPPAYTGLPPIFLKSGGETVETIAAPQGSQLLARYHGGGDAVLTLGEEATPFQRVTAKDQQLETRLDRSGDLVVTGGGRRMGAWRMEITPDAPPTVEITKKPEPTMRGALRIVYHATDDYGMTGVTMHIRRVDGTGEERFELPLPGRRQTKVTDVVFRDLTAHRWAGLPIQMVLEVRDDAGQSGLSKPVLMVLPERRFNQPAARAVVEQRRKLIADAAANRDWVVRAIRALQINPGVYNDDFAAHLMLSLAAAELGESGAPAVLADNELLLWRTALRIEDGQLAVALNKLRDVQDRLMEALANGASDEEIQALMDELEQAMNDYLESMQQQALERLQDGEPTEQGSQAQQLEERALSDLIDKARELSRSGARDRTREMLSQLQNMLENLQMSARTQPGQAEQQADRMLEELGRMMERQQQLRDRTFERQQRQQQPNSQRPSQRDPFRAPPRNRFGRSPNTDTQNPSRGGTPSQTGDEDLAEVQERLRRQLGELMRRLGENGMGIPDELGQAEGAMRDSEGALGEGNREGALGSQAEALDRLRRGTESVLEDMAQSGQNPGQGDEGATQAGVEGEQLDPLGRTPTESWGDTAGEVVPGEGALQRSREILDELRRRAGDRHRGAVERDYLDRLLQQF